MSDVARLWWVVLKCTCLVLLVGWGDGGVAATAGDQNTSPAVAEGYVLDLANPIVRRTIGPDLVAPENKRFVRITVTQVSNPRRIPLSFEVHFQADQGERVYLGTVSLFPSDRPGRFIVSMRNKPVRGGTVTVTLVPLAKVSAGEKIRVYVQSIMLVAE